MTRDETIRIMSVLRGAYPGFYRGINRKEADATVNLWQTVFADEPYEQVSMAVLALIKSRTSTFPPVPGDVSEKLQELFSPQKMTELEGWSLVQKALRNSLYNAKEEYDKLPPAVQRAVGDPGQLRRWAQSPEDELETVVASNFQRSYRVVQKRELEFAQLPQSARDKIQALTDLVTKPMLDDGAQLKLEEG